MKNENKVIGNDEATYKYWLIKEESVRNAYNEIVDLAVQSLGKKDLIIDHSELVESPYEYTLKVFWDTYCQNEPSHLDKDRVFTSKTSLTQTLFDSAKRNFKDATKQMTQHFPTIAKTGLKSNLEKERFDIYLHPDKAEEYNAVLAFMNAAKELRDRFNGGGSMHVVRMHSSILLGNNAPEINPNYFKL